MRLAKREGKNWDKQTSSQISPYNQEILLPLRFHKSWRVVHFVVASFGNYLVAWFQEAQIQNLSSPVTMMLNLSQMAAENTHQEAHRSVPYNCKEVAYLKVDADKNQADQATYHWRCSYLPALPLVHLWAPPLVVKVDHFLVAQNLKVVYTLEPSCSLCLCPWEA